MISICMSTYNGEKFIYKQLESIRNQSLKPDEVIICDDCSADGTVKIVEQFISEYKLDETWKLYQNKQNKGYPENFYYTMNMCQGDVVFLADQDDLWETDKIESMYSVMEENPQTLLLASKWGIIDGEDKILKEISRGRLGVSGQCDKITVSDVLYCYDWPGMSMCYRKSFGAEVIKAAKESRLAHDVAMSLMAAEREGFQCLHKVNQYHRRHGDNVALEEHRIRKILNKKRKIMEIERYLKQLTDIISGDFLKKEDNIKMILCKKSIMEERLNNLQNKRRRAIISQYIEHKKEIRLSTVICDWLICGQKI